MRGAAWGALQANTGAIIGTRVSIDAPVGGLASLAGGAIELRGAFVRAEQAGTATDAASVDLFDVELVGEGPTDFANPAIDAAEGGVVRAERVWIHDWTGVGLLARGGAIEVSDARVEQLRPITRPSTPFPSNESATGAAAVDGGTLRLTRAHVSDFSSLGIEVTRSTAELRDVRVARLSGSNLEDPRGLAIFDAEVMVARVVLEEIDGWGVDAYIRSRVTGTELIARDLQPGRFGWGIGIQARSGSSFSLDRVQVDRAHGVAIWAGGADTAVELSHVAVRDIAPRRCSFDECTEAPAGVGVVVNGARVTLSDFEVAGASLCGVEVGVGSSLQLNRGRIRSSAIGACVHEPAYPLESLTADVAYEDTEVTIDTRTTPVPEPPGFAQ